MSNYKTKRQKKQSRQQRQQQWEARKVVIEKCLTTIDEVNSREPVKLTIEEIFASRSRYGGWTREILAQWGVSWPPRKGWIERLVAGERQD